MSDLPSFVDVRRFRVRLPEPLFPYHGRGTIAGRDDADVPVGEDGWLAVADLGEFFGGEFSERNPLNLPGPFYGAATDNCLTGPMEAPGNVLVDGDGREFVARQPATAAEFADMVGAAVSECFQGYGVDGDSHWRLSLVREWWAARAEMAEAVGERWCEPGVVEAWRRALGGGARSYLRGYAFFVEQGRLPAEGDLLPDID